MSLFGRTEVIRDPDGWGLSFDDGRTDSLSYRDPETGLVVHRPVAASPEEKRQAEIDSWRHGLESVERRIATSDPTDRFLHGDDPTEKEIEKRRASMEGERQKCLDELARLGVPVTEPTGRRRRR
jgi:hypothetical protein